ncbi:15697_t:CDS:2, partial [Dentiscutata heterogama]
RPRLGVNEPPLVPYRLPIIGHTYSYIFDTENLFKKCKNYGDTFSLYVFGDVRTFTGAETAYEVLMNNSIFDFHLAVEKVDIYVVIEIL